MGLFSICLLASSWTDAGEFSIQSWQLREEVSFGYVILYF